MTELTVLQSIPVAIFCNLVVYIVLFALWGMIIISNKVIVAVTGGNRPGGGSGQAS
ncbi:MAG: hypothetical protein LBL73_01165 [Synergistaceae bacterium]|jgi:hypothetical protein|nr:hypothetical protein [Synergistaceae bacterium]